MHRQCGFTLLELLVTLGIAAILAGMAIPAYANLAKRTNAQTLAYQLVALVQFARTEAINKKVVVSLCGSGDGAKCTNDWSKTILVFTDNNSNGLIDGRDALLRSVTVLKNGETLAWRSFRNKPYLQLQANGMTYFQNGNFTYCPVDGDEHFALHWIINVSGYLRIAADKNKNGIPEKANGKDIRC